MNSDGAKSHRRYITIMFSDVADSTAIAARMEPETYSELLQQMRAIFEQIIPRHGGQIVRIDGDGVMSIFGYPHSYEDASRRAAEAAIDLHAASRLMEQAFASPDRPFRFHTGIHSGVVLFSKGDLVRGRFELLGDATNVAARLCDNAKIDEILASETSLGADQRHFITSPARSISIAGRDSPISVVHVLDRDLMAGPFEIQRKQGIANLIGRNAELEMLNGALKKCSEHKYPVVFLHGSAGIGKSRLANEFLDKAQSAGFEVYRGYCDSNLGAGLLQPFRQIMDEISDHGESKNELPVATLLSKMVYLLNRRPLCKPPIFFIDDWHWADDASRQFLTKLMTDLSVPALFLLAAREIDDGFTEEIIALKPLGNKDAESAIELLLASPEPFLVERIREKAGGSPLYIEELCHATQNGAIPEVGKENTAWLDMLVQARLLQLPDELISILKLASVIGHVIPAWLFEAASGIGVDDAIVDRLATEDFLYPGKVAGTLRFKHGITCDSIYNVIGLSQRKALHKKLAGILELKADADGEGELLELLAYHYDGCDDTERALHFSMKAGEKALEASALDRAQAQFGNGLRFIAALVPTPEREKLLSQLIHKFGLACVVDPSPEQLSVLDHAAKFSQSQGNIDGLMRARYWLGAISYGMGDAMRSIVEIEAAADLGAEASSVGFFHQLNASLAQSYFAASRYDKAIDLFDKVIPAMMDLNSARSQSGLAYAIGSSALLAGDQGKFYEATRDIKLAENMLKGRRPAMWGSILNKRSAICLWQGKFDDGIRFANEGIYHGMHTRSRYYTMMSRALAGYAKWKIDGNSDSVETLERATNWFLTKASKHRTSLCHGWMAEIMSYIGDVSKTRRYASHAFQRARKGDRLGEAMAARALARIATISSSQRSAQYYLNIAYRSAALRGSARERAETQLCDAQMAAQAGRILEARQLAEAAHLSFQDMEMQYQASQAAALQVQLSSR